MKRLFWMLLALAALLTLVSCETPEDPKNAVFSAFIVNGTTISIDAEAAPILASLGKEQAYSESPSCAFEGMDKIYVYAGFRVQTYTQGGKDFIRAVELTDDSVATAEKIAIGATRDAVIGAYGEASSATDTALTYEGEGGVKLQFLLRDGAVTNIQYQKAVD